MTDEAKIKSINEIEAVLRESPQRRFQIFRRNLSEASGATKDGGSWNGGPPFDVKQVMRPAGKINSPFPSHKVTSELYWILDGEGFTRIGDHRHAIKSGDFFMCPPECPHQIEATTPLIYAVIANNVHADVGHYPDSNKWISMPERICFRGSVDYYDGEEGHP